VFHAGAAAPNAELLMRSRYSAYVLQLEAYLRTTWHSSTCPTEALFEKETMPKWIGLEVVKHAATGDQTAMVEFIARYRVGGRAGRMHELSRFVQDGGHWLYLDGQQIE
jgi:SEC-C motif-containing protein